MQDSDNDITTPTPELDFDKISIIDNFLNMRNKFIQKVEKTESLAHSW